MAKVLLKDVTKLYEGSDKLTVEKMNLDIKDQEFVVFVGPSGCGKSTTLRMVAGLEEVTDGDIFIGEGKVNDVPPKDRDIAMVFQNYALYPHMNVYDNMAFGLRLRSFPEDEIDKRVREAADLLGMEGLLDRKPKQMSGGQRQRVALGRAIVRQPKVFLMDEPLSNLDAKLRVQMRAEISKLHNRLKTTIIYVTHDQVEAMTMGDRIVVLKDGFIMQNDTPQQIYDHPANKFVAGFIGSPPMNFIDCTVKKVNNSLFLKSDDTNLEVPKDKAELLKNYIDNEVTVGIRPEDIYPIANPKIKQTPYNVIKSKVIIFELMGAEIYVYQNISGINFVSRLEPETKVKEGEVLELVIDTSKIHIFNKDTELAIF